MSVMPVRLSAPVVTVLAPSERQSVDAAGQGFYRTIHRDSLADAMHEMRRRKVTALLLSVVHCGAESDRRVATMVREFPTVPALALLSTTPTNADALLRFGHAGITRVVDVRQPAGWSQLRRILAAESMRTVDRMALARVRDELGPVAREVWFFFEALFLSADSVRTVRQLAARLEVLPSTLMSLFHRAKLPAPKQYLAFARLIRAARLFEDPGHSILDVSNAMEFSAPQSFARHLRVVAGMSIQDFRRTFTAVRMIDRFIDTLVRPHGATLRRLDSLIPARQHALPPSILDRRPARTRRAK